MHNWHICSGSASVAWAQGLGLGLGLGLGCSATVIWAPRGVKGALDTTGDYFPILAALFTTALQCTPDPALLDTTAWGTVQD